MSSLYPQCFPKLPANREVSLQSENLSEKARAMLKCPFSLSPGRSRCGVRKIEEILASSETDNLLLSLDNEIVVEAEIPSVVVAEVAIEKSDLNTTSPNGPVIQ
jgi:hypothetical protein